LFRIDGRAGQPAAVRPVDLPRLAGDHLLATIDSELRWVDEALGVVTRTRWPVGSEAHPAQDIPSKTT